MAENKDWHTWLGPVIPSHMNKAAPLEFLQDVLTQARRAGADAADAVLVHSRDLSVSQRMGKPEDIERAESSDLGLRVFCGRRTASVSSNDLNQDAVEEACERAVAMARAATEDPYAALAEPALWAEDPPALDLCESEEPPIEWLREQAAICEGKALAHAGITNSEGATAGFTRHDLALATSAGFARAYASGSCALSVALVAGEGEHKERDYDYTAARYRSDLLAAETVAQTAAERTLARLHPRRVKTLQAPVVFDPRVGRSLLSSFAAAINGQSVARGTSFLQDKKGAAVFAPDITIIDDPHRVRGLGSRPFDGEGVANQRRAMVEDGVLQSWFLDLRAANQLGLATTGHASRGLSGTSPAPSNLYLQAGACSPQALMQDISEGLYVTETFGMGINLVTGDYSQGASGFWIENGAIAYPVSELTIAGHLGEMFARLTPADDLIFRYATNVPTLRIDGMTIAGT